MKQKMNYKKAGEVSNWLFIAAVAAIGGTLFFTGWTQLILFVLGVGLIVSGIAVRVIYWRCPHCKNTASWLPAGTEDLSVLQRESSG